MNALNQLKTLLGVGASKTSGIVQRTGSSITVASSAGVLVVPSPNVVVSVGDLVIIESNQITHVLGQESEIRTYDV